MGEPAPRVPEKAQPSQKDSQRPIISSPQGRVQFRRDAFILAYTEPIKNYYEIDEQKLGQGTYGSVSKAIHLATKAERAVKTIPKVRVKNVQRFRQEIEIMKGLDHPNIIKLFETFEDTNYIYLVLELCHGGELFDRIIDDEFISEQFTAVLMRQILAAIFYIHQNKIVHRDLKPENFLFLEKKKDSVLKIIDFGLAARCDQDTILSTKAGTPYYVAPQVLRGQYTNKCDLWSAGVIMYILLCGYPPFHGDNDSEILQKAKAGKYVFNHEDWKNVSREARDLIRNLLRVNPNERFSAEQALGHCWFTLFEQKLTPQQTDELTNSRLIEKFRTFRHNSRFKKAALTVIAQQLSPQQISKLRDIFNVLDVNKDGTLTAVEIRDGLRKSGITDVPADFEHVLSEVDSDGSGVIDYTEFIAAALERKDFIQEDVLRSAFSRFDIDGNGKITRDELKQVWNTLDEDEISGMIKDIDKNDDGEIDFEEFMIMMRSRDR
eukprot:Selendium_serpulae@DN4815_c1_g1_i2.p1